MQVLRKLRIQTTHTRFALAYSFLLYGICNALNIGKLARWFQGADGLELGAFCAYLLCGLCLFTAVFTLLVHRRTVKPLALFLLVASAAATYFIAKYDVAVDSSMLVNTLHTDTTEVGQLLSPWMIPYVLLLMVLPAVVILAADITFEPRGRYLVASAAVFLAATSLAVGLLYLNYNAIHRAGNVSNKYIVYSLVPINIIASTTSVVSKSARDFVRAHRPRQEIVARVTKPRDLVVVLAIGESSRRKNFSLYGYERRETNPVLREMPGLHRLNGIARRGSTIYALREILEKQDVKLTEIVAKAGVRTSCLVNYTVYDNCAAVGETKTRDCAHGGKCFDEDVVPLLRAELAGYASGERFVVLHLGGGSHGPLYANRHPPEFLRFKPTCDDADVANRCSVEQLYNSYDNTLLYVDHVLGEVVRTLEDSRAPYVLIYLSDHGESLLEDGRLFHGVPPGMDLPREQAEIPLLVKSSVSITVMQRAEYSQPDVFDTVLDLLAVESPGFDRSGNFIARAE
jgi:lipid A ethanolaminephosphotransferase